MSGEPAVRLRLDAVILAVTHEEPRVLAVGEPPALPSGLLDPTRDATLEQALRRWVREQADLELGYVEQLYTFGDRDRDPAAKAHGQRLVSVAYLALVEEEDLPGQMPAQWHPVYHFLPWEDWRAGRPALLEGTIAPALDAWVGAVAGVNRATRRERADITFGLGGATWDGERALERYELLYELGMPAEARRRRQIGAAMALDHRRILATALSRLRGKLGYRPLVFELLPETFTLFELQRLVEALAGLRLHKGNFRRLVETGGLVEGTGQLRAATGGRPAELFRFRREVLRERPAPGVGLPGLRG